MRSAVSRILGVFFLISVTWNFSAFAMSGLGRVVVVVVVVLVGGLFCWMARLMILTRQRGNFGVVHVA